MDELRRRRAGPARAAAGRAAPHRPKGSPALIVLMTIAVLPSTLVANAWGAGAAGIIGGLTGMFSLIAFMGGPLRADLRVTAVLGPLLVFAAAIPRLVADTSRPAAMALVVALTVVAALLPLFGPRFGNAGMGLGMTTMYGYGYAPTGAADHRQVLIAAVAGVLVAVALRVLMGVSDPSKPTREQVAAILTAEDPGAATATAFGTWLRDRRQRWLADAMEGASRFRVALREAALDGAAADDLDVLRERAAALAGQLRAKPRKDRTVAASDLPPEDAGTGPLAEASLALGAIEAALRTHDPTPVRLERDRRRALRHALLHPSGRLRSIQVRHAVRTALAVLAMLLITAGLDRGDPLVVTALLTTFAILQASWSETARKARNKVIGVVAGALAVAVVLIVVPSQYLVLVAVVALCLGLWYIVTRPALGNAFMVMVSVGLNAVIRDLDAASLLAQYVLLTGCALLIGVLLGFTVIPRFHPAPLRVRVAGAAQATADALRASADGTGPPDPHGVELFHTATRMQDDLVPDRERLDDAQLAELERLRTALRDLTVLADAAPVSRVELDQVVRALSPEEPSASGAADDTEPEASGAVSSTLWSLAQQAGAAERHLLASLPTPR